MYHCRIKKKESCTVCLSLHWISFVLSTVRFSYEVFCAISLSFVPQPVLSSSSYRCPTSASEPRGLADHRWTFLPRSPTAPGMFFFYLFSIFIFSVWDQSLDFRLLYNTNAGTSQSTPNSPHNNHFPSCQHWQTDRPADIQNFDSHHTL